MCSHSTDLLSTYNLPIVEVSADIRINVINVKLSKARSVEGPGAVVADHSLGTIWSLSWLRSGLSGSLSGCMGDPITDTIHPATYPVTLMDTGVESCSWRTLMLLTKAVQK